MSLELRINGEDRTVDAGTIMELLRAEGVDETARFVAVAVNGTVAPRADWTTRSLGSGDDVEIVNPVSGG
jgi:sulfur carrier protein